MRNKKEEKIVNAHREGQVFIEKYEVDFVD